MNPRPRPSWLSLLAAAAVCAGCAGSDFEWNKASQVQPGMSEQQVTALMGPPTDVRTQTYGVAWSWAYDNPSKGSARATSVVFRDGLVVSSPGVPQSFIGK